MLKVFAIATAFLLPWGLVAADAWAKGRWQQPENSPPCLVWNASPQANETARWSGQCVHGKAEGEGRLIWRYLTDGEPKEERYKGTMRAGQLHGRGAYLWANGGRYRGDWNNGKLHGDGQIWYPNGNGYQGQWADDNRHGQGTFLFADGDECHGGWHDDNVVGRGQGWRHNEGRIVKCHMEGSIINFTD
ncbi:MAG: hypothetical protein HOC72_23405 [Rhodospirillaceae bacterium]|nr:hypothetical protein [Rhodospirillaceae bacterium]